MVLVCLFLSMGYGCSPKDVELVEWDGGHAVVSDAAATGDGQDPGNPECSPGKAQCNNCIDDDGDGFVDGHDVECTGALDDNEGSFSTGIPGDNSDPIKQDCFFDGNSGGGDGCSIHVCCLLEPLVNCCDGEETPEETGCLKLTGPKYKPDECVATQSCVDNCAPITPPGCDCFGCCTVCEGEECRDILTNPSVYEFETCEGIVNPATGECCTADNLASCYSCTKVANCNGGSCDGDGADCQLCPGQNASDLPESCEVQECPEGLKVCSLSADCDAAEYCSNGCCLTGIE